MPILPQIVGIAGLIGAAALVFSIEFAPPGRLPGAGDLAAQNVAAFLTEFGGGEGPPNREGVELHKLDNGRLVACGSHFTAISEPESGKLYSLTAMRLPTFCEPRDDVVGIRKTEN